MKKTGIVTAVLLAVILITSAAAWAAEFTEVQSGSLSVRYDDGTGALFKELPVNYARLNRLDLSDAVIISGSGYSIKEAQSGYSDRTTRPHLVWKGKVKFGGDSRTASTNAVTTENALPPVTLKFPEGATLSDGREADVIVTLDQIKLNLTKSFNNSINDNTDVFILLAFSDKRGLWLNVSSPKTAIDKWDYTNADKSSSAGNGTNVKLSMKITEKASGKTVGNVVSQEDYPSMLIEYKDLDVRDHTIRTSAEYTEKYNGSFAEGLELVNGWGNPVVLAPIGEGILNQSLLDKKIVNGNTRIKGKGSQYEALEKVTGNPNDNSSFYSGFAAPASTAGFSFCWTGSVPGGPGAYSNMATLISGQPIVAVRAKRSEGGSLGNTEIGARSGLDSFYNNTHLMNSAATYYYEPDEGWSVEYLKVDGKEIELTAEERAGGGAYDFTRLNKSPVTERVIRDGNILDAEDNSFYEIEVRYIRNPAYKTEKSAEPGIIRTMDNEPVTYTIHCREIFDRAAAGSHQIRDDLAGGLLRIVPGSVKVTVTDNSAYKIDKNDDNGLWVTFSSCKADGSCPEITITYQATVNWEKYESGAITNLADDSQAELDTFSDIVVAKEVKGKLRDTSKQFEFRADLEGLDPAASYNVDSDGGKIISIDTGTASEEGFKPDDEGKASLRFTLCGEQRVSLKGLPVGTRYRIHEEANNHIPSYVQTSDQQDPHFIKKEDTAGRNNTALSTEWETLDKQDGMVTLTFVNSRDPAPVTGVAGTGWIAATAVSALLLGSAGALYVFRICRKNTKGGDI